MAKFEGRESLLRKMKAMPPAVRSAIKQALAQGADEITAMQKRLVQVKDGDLRDSITQTWGGGKVRYASVGTRYEDKGDPDLTVRLSAGNAQVRYAHLVEFGTGPHSVAKGARRKYSGMVHALTSKGKARQHPGSKPQPFFFPPYRALRRRVLSRVSRATSRAVRSMARK
ncbi:HK97-gp10 family putative phage morphogenesis protein [Pseudochelatococcus sp. B33]